ncbi:MAG: hypothetical protein GMKNLPBB_02019 [Myxococcota bacterium]|nr:hypothetical protein [Myxococcota bacterium]
MSPPSKVRASLTLMFAYSLISCQASIPPITLNNVVTACGSGDCKSENSSTNNTAANQSQGFGADAGLSGNISLDGGFGVGGGAGDEASHLEEEFDPIIAVLPDGYYSEIDTFIVSETILGPYEFENPGDAGRRLYQWINYLGIITGNPVFQYETDPPRFTGNWKPEIIIRNPDGSLRRGARDPFLRLISDEKGGVKIGGKNIAFEIIKRSVSALTPSPSEPPPGISNCRQFAEKNGFWCSLSPIDNLPRCMEVDTDLVDVLFYESYGTDACASGVRCREGDCEVEGLIAGDLFTVISNYYNANYTQSGRPFHSIQTDYVCANCKRRKPCVHAEWWAVSVGIGSTEGGTYAGLEVPPYGPSSPAGLEARGIIGAAVLITAGTEIRAQVWEGNDTPRECQWTHPSEVIPSHAKK